MPSIPVFDANTYRYPSKRHLTYAARGMVCTSQPLASQAGLRMIQMGGNAIDAALAAAICLTVVEPTSNGLGSDCFAQIWSQGKLHAINGSGYAPERLTTKTLREASLTQIPFRNWHAVTIPGAPSAWAMIHEKFGKLPFQTLFEPAIEYAKNGFALTPTIARFWREGYKDLSPFRDEPAIRPWFETFIPDGRIPQTGDIIKLPDHAKTLEILAQSHCEDFYRGDIAREIVRFSKQTSGFIEKDDLESYRAQWVDPVQIDYHGYRISELPPNGHGIVALMALNILKHCPLDKRDTPQTFHTQIEAMKLAFADGMQFIADPNFMKTRVEDLLSEDYAKSRLKCIKKYAQIPTHGTPFSGGTVYLATADGDGNMVSFIQSNYKDFGAGVVLPGWGINFNDRGACFSLDPKSDNCLAPRKKPYHTIIPGFLLKGDLPVGPFGVMGAYMQPQGHVQVISNLIDFHLNPQEALDAPRWQWLKDNTVALEDNVGKSIAQNLLKRGHDIHIRRDDTSFGRGQIILRLENGALVGATEPRADSNIAVC